MLAANKDSNRMLGGFAVLDCPSIMLLPGADPALEFGEGHYETNMGVRKIFLEPRPSDSRKTWETPLLLHLRSITLSLNLHSS